jgi:tagaturonate reductase
MPHTRPDASAVENSLKEIRMPNNSLPTLSLQLLEQLRKQGDSRLELPPESLFSAPETILQMGWGKFMRGFAPDFVQLANQDGRYVGRILTVQRSRDHRSEASARQDALYTLILRGIERGRLKEVKRIIGSISRLLVAEKDWDKIVAAVRNQSLRVILSNATETGLTLDPADRPDGRPPRSFPGKLTQLLFERWRATAGRDADIAVIPMELVLNNGPLVRGLILEQARGWNLGTAFLDWAQSSVHVASTLVDRIVVGTPREDLLAKECAALGYRDDLLTCGESFYLFAITADEFTRRHFPMHLASPNVRFVDDLAPFRWRKLRVLNGPQMVLATLGTLLGFRIIRQAVEDPQVGPFDEQSVWQEIIPAMGPEEEAVNSDYARECLERIGNPNIEHRLQGIRVDLTTKNSIRLIPSIRDFLKLCNRLPGRLLLTMAATLEVVLRGGLEDAHADYILERWAVAAPHSRESLLTFTHEALAHLSAQTHEPLDVERIAPEVRDLLVEIREQGLRAVLARRYALQEPVSSEPRVSS